MTKTIYCGAEGQYEAIVDDCDYEYLSQWKWSFKRSSQKYGEHIYARRGGSINAAKTKHQTILMHVEIMQLAGKKQPSKHHTVDHKNCDTLDNRRDNLEWATKLEQARNQRRYKGNGERKTNLQTGDTRF